MKKYDFRFDQELIQSFVGKTFNQYKCSIFVLRNSATGIVGIEIDNKIYKLTLDYEGFDFLSIDGEATIYRISNSDWKEVDSLIIHEIDEINEIKLNETIKKIILVNDHTIVKSKDAVEYDMWETKAIIFCFEETELCFAREDLWFSLEIEVYKGYNLLDQISDGKDVLEDFQNIERLQASVDRTIIELK